MKLGGSFSAIHQTLVRESDGYVHLLLPGDTYWSDPRLMIDVRDVFDKDQFNELRWRLYGSYGPLAWR